MFSLDGILSTVSSHNNIPVPSLRGSGTALSKQRGKKIIENTFTLLDNLEILVDLSCMCFDGGRKPQQPEENPHKQKASLPPNKKEHGHDSNPQTSCCEATVLTAEYTTLVRTLIA